jgi:hypothetical protein
MKGGESGRDQGSGALSNRAPEPMSGGLQIDAPWQEAELYGSIPAQIRVGVDTVSVAWHVAAAADLHWAIAEGTVGDAEAPQVRKLPRGWITRKPIQGMHVGSFHDRGSKSGTVFIEGRAMQLWNPLSRGLLHLNGLRRLADRSEHLFGELGVSVAESLNEGTSTPATLRRLDLACDILVTPEVGAQILADFVSVPSSCDKQAYFSKGENCRITSIIFSHRSSGIQFRAYCKATQQGSGEYGSHLRFERQLRWVRSDRPEVGTWIDDANPGSAWADRFRKWSGVIPNEGIPLVAQAVRANVVSKSAGRSLAGALCLGEPLTGPMQTTLQAVAGTTNVTLCTPLVQSVIAIGASGLGGDRSLR